SIDSLPNNDPSADSASQRADSLLELADVLFDRGEYRAALDNLKSLNDNVDLGSQSPTQLARASVIRGDVLNYLEQDAVAKAAYLDALVFPANSAVRLEDRARFRCRAIRGLALLVRLARHH